MQPRSHKGQLIEDERGDLIVNFDMHHSDIRFLFRKTSVLTVEKIVGEFKQFKKRNG